MSDVSNVDPEFLAEAPTETPVQPSQLAAMAQEDGDFDNFTYVNSNKFSDLVPAANGSSGQSQVRPSTELINLKQSFASVRPDDLDETESQSA